MIRTMTRTVAVCMSILSATLASAGDGAASETTGCVDRLAQTLDSMRSGPLLKEEHATALMWLRMDAAEAAAAGDEQECLVRVAIVEDLLGLPADLE
jgi:hypothetical protein